MVTKTQITLILVVGIGIQSFGAILTRLAGEMSPVAIAAFRMIFSSMLLLGYARLTPGQPDRARPSGHPLILCLLSGVFLAAHFVCWIFSLQYTSVAASVVIVNMNAFFVGVISSLFFKEKLQAKLLLGMVIAFAGCTILTVNAPDFNGFDLATSGAMRGNILALMGALASAAYIAIGSRVRQTISLVSYITTVYTTAALLLIGLCTLLDISFTGYGATTYLYVFLMAAGPQLVGHSAVNWALKHMNSALVAVTKMGEPIFSALLAWLFFSELITPGQIPGILCIFTGIIIALVYEKPGRPSHRTTPIE